MIRTTVVPVFDRHGLCGLVSVADDEFTCCVLGRTKWSLNKEGYPVAQHTRRYVYMHHLVFQHYHGDRAGSQDIDHEDRNLMNCTPDNLRLASRSTNIANSGKRKTNKSGYKGVSFCKVTGRWRASIQVLYKCINLGRYESKKEAARSVNDAYRKFFPEVRIPNPEAEQ